MNAALSRLAGSSVAAVLALSALPVALTAQEQQQMQEQNVCTITVRSGADMESAAEERGEMEEHARQGQESVPTVWSGRAAVALEVRMPEGLGSISEFVPPEGSGLALASTDDLAKNKLAMSQTEEGQQPKPIAMAAEGSRRAMVWINTTGARSGTYRVTFRGSDAECHARLRVRGEENAG